MTPALRPAADAWRRGLPVLPHEPKVRQTILINHAGRAHKAWMFDKGNDERNGDLQGRLIVLTGRLQMLRKDSWATLGHALSRVLELLFKALRTAAQRVMSLVS